MKTAVTGEIIQKFINIDMKLMILFFRLRSSSLTSDNPSRRVRHMTGLPSRPNVNRNSGPDEKQLLLTFHQELTETCVDLMARYSFSNCGVSPKRSNVTQFLLSQVFPIILILSVDNYYCFRVSHVPG